MKEDIQNIIIENAGTVLIDMVLLDLKKITEKLFINESTFIKWLNDKQIVFLNIKGKGYFKINGSEMNKLYTLDEVYKYWKSWQTRKKHI